jgi:hypothetical protein
MDLQAPGKPDRYVIERKILYEPTAVRRSRTAGGFAEMKNS